jgi:hypothetical protein
MAQLAATQDGKFILEHLRHRTIERPNMPMSAPDGVAMGMLMCHQEGEKNIVRYMEQCVEKGRKKK